MTATTRERLIVDFSRGSRRGEVRFHNQNQPSSRVRVRVLVRVWTWTHTTPTRVARLLCSCHHDKEALTSPIPGYALCVVQL